MRTITKRTFKLTEAEVKEAIVDYISKINSAVIHLEENDISLKIDYTQRAIPGIDPHDCDYVDEFDGVTVVEK